MARVKGALMTRKRRKKTLKLAKGYWGSKSRHFKMAKQAVMKSGNYAYFCCLPYERDLLFRIYERSEESGRNAQPQDALRGCHC